jgi:hypothetical protein
LSCPARHHGWQELDLKRCKVIQRLPLAGMMVHRCSPEQHPPLLVLYHPSE